MALAPSFASEQAQPLHVAIILDGNGRWAKARGLPRIAGHRRGAEVVRTVLKGCNRYGVRYLTLYAFSSENWKRPVDEVQDLMGLLRLYLRREIADLRRNGVRIGFIGDRARLSREINDLIVEAEESTRHNTKLTLTVALNYGGRQEILDTTRRIAEQVRDGVLDPDALTEDVFASHLNTCDLPDPDLVIRTSGEQRLSNFLLWQSAYSELVFVPTLWPDFTLDHLEQAISEFKRRERRYGGTGG
jgi:undecaprenyl diphosphate synthase